MIGKYTHDEFMDMARFFHNYPAPGLIIGGYMVEMARAGLPKDILFDAICESANCLPDAVQLLTPCTTGNGWLRIVNLGLYALCLYDKFTGKGVRVRLDPDKLGPWSEIRCWHFKEKPKKEQDSERLQREIREAGYDILTAQEVQVAPAYVGKTGAGPIGLCPLCGEPYPVRHGGICRSCQGESPYMAGHGVRLSGRPDLTAPVLESINVNDAVGRRVLHDMTRIEPGQSKGAEFRKGQEITAGDVCRLQHMGRNRVYVEGGDGPGEGWVHEDQAAQAFAEAMIGPGAASCGDPREGKVTFKAATDGLLCVDFERLERFNLAPGVMCATRHDCTVVNEGAVLGATRAIPLFLPRTDFIKAMDVLGGEPLVSVRPMRAARVGILVTGTEVFQGLINDKFEPIIRQKTKGLGCTVAGVRIVPDDRDAIAGAARELLDEGADLIITTAGLSVDPEDVTRHGLADAGLEDALYGMPVLPGAMTLVGRMGPAQVLGVPACALFYKTTSLDLILPRLLAGVPVTRLDLARLGHGGMCMNCKTCNFPKCPFGR